jgi:hypothetical protein
MSKAVDPNDFAASLVSALFPTESPIENNGFRVRKSPENRAPIPLPD